MKFCALVSGSSGNSVLVCENKTKILVDSGRSGKHIAACLAHTGTNPEEISAILVTHEHSDHVSSVGIMSRRYDIPIYATSGTWDGMQIGKVKDENIRVIEEGVTIDLGDLAATAFAIPHDANQPVGYRFESGGAVAVVATDIGHLSETVCENVLGADAVLLEANHDVARLKMGPYPYYLKQRILSTVGHLSNSDAARLACELVKSGTRYITLGHLSEENNTPRLAFCEVTEMMAAEGIDYKKDIALSVAERNFCSQMVVI